MPDRTSHQHGTISWTDLATTDQEGAKEFYAGLFGWEYEDMPAGEDAIYSMAKLARPLRRRDLAAAGRRGRAGHPAALERLRDGRGRRRGRRRRSPRRAARCSPGPSTCSTRAAWRSSRIPPAAVLCLWQAGTNIGAEVVNEPGAMSWADTRDDRRGGRAGVLHGSLLGWRFEPMSEEPPYWVIFNGERSQGRDDGAAAGRALELVPLLRGRRRRRVDRRRRRRPAATPFLGPIDVPNGGRFALIVDPQGAPFAVLRGENSTTELAFQIPSVLEYRRYGNRTPDPRRATRADPRRPDRGGGPPASSEGGFHATSLDQIAAAAGYTKGAVYSNFASKEDLFFAVYERRAAARRRRWRELFAGDRRRGPGADRGRHQRPASIATTAGWRCSSSSGRT